MLATWKDLCIDALDRVVMGRFWAVATGLELNVSDRNVSLDGPTPRHRIWVNQVDRAKTVKGRIHLDVDVVHVDELVALGARVARPAASTGFPWSVLLDPEGNEFCAFERPAAEVPAYRLHGVVVDSVDPFAIGAWWAGVLGTTAVDDREHGYSSVQRVAVDERMTLDFVPVTEPRVGPHRVHWDLVGDAEALLAAGATHLWDTERWRVLADPEGNEFCVFAQD